MSHGNNKRVFKIKCLCLFILGLNMIWTFHCEILPQRVHKQSSVNTVILYMAQHKDSEHRHGGNNWKKQSLTLMNHNPINTFPTVWQHCPLQAMILYRPNIHNLCSLGTWAQPVIYEVLNRWTWTNGRLVWRSNIPRQHRKHLMRYTTGRLRWFLKKLSILCHIADGDTQLKIHVKLDLIQQTTSVSPKSKETLKSNSL